MNVQQQCQEDLVQVSAAVLTVDTRRFESDHDAIDELIACMVGHANAAITALERVIENFESGPDLDPADTLVTGAGVPVVDIAFIAHVYLRQRSERLARLGKSPNSWLVIAESASLRRHILKSMIRVEQAVCAELGVSAELGHLHDLDVALASRRVYQHYIRSVRAIGERVEGGTLDMVGALRLCATNVAQVIGRDVYEHLRVDDRQQLRSLQQRIFSAVQHPEDELSIRRLWMDICASAELFKRIHERNELIEHDFELLAELLGDGSATLRLDAEGRERLAELEGRDAQLDRLLGDASCPEARLRPELIELHDRLARSLGRAPLAVAAPGQGEVIDLCVW